jgi:glycosyltransferase involved in cell wall biosynthesis
MHVAVVMAGSHLGGAERSLLSLVQSTASLSFTLIVPEDGELAAAAVSSGAEVRVQPWADRLLTLGERSGRPSVARLGSVLPAVRDAAGRLRDLLRSLAPDVVVTNGVKPHALGSLALRTLPAVPLVWYLRESMERRPVARLVLRTLAGRCDGAIAVSRYVANDAAYLAPRTRVDVLYNIVNVPILTPFPPFPKPAGEIWFAAIGALTPLKGHDVFLRAAAKVHGVCPEARFLIAGSNRYAPERTGGYEERLHQLVREQGLGSVVRFLGQRSDVGELLRHVDVLVQPNTGPEGFGRSVIEAMQAGVPVIASRGWSFLELIDHGSTGWLVPPGNPQALAYRMIGAAANASARRRVGRAGLAFARTIRTADCVAGFEAALHRAVARRNGTVRACA